MIRLFLILIVAAICQARINFEISLGQSSDWTSAGWTELTPGGQVLDVSNGVKDAQHTTSDSLVYVRLANHPNVQTSIPAPCWSGEVTLHVEDGATPVALSFPSCSKAQLTQQQEPNTTTTTIIIPTSISRVYTTHPASANTITMKQLKEMFDALSSASKSGSKKASPYAQDEEEEDVEEEGGGDGGKRKRKQPPPDDRTWLQKNWMLVLPLGLVVFNRMIAPPPPEAQQGGGGAPRR